MVKQKKDQMMDKSILSDIVPKSTGGLGSHRYYVISRIRRSGPPGQMQRWILVEDHPTDPRLEVVVGFYPGSELSREEAATHIAAHLALAYKDWKSPKEIEDVLRLESPLQMGGQW